MARKTLAIFYMKSPTITSNQRHNHPNERRREHARDECGQRGTVQDHKCLKIQGKVLKNHFVKLQIPEKNLTNHKQKTESNKNKTKLLFSTELSTKSEKNPHKF